MAHAPFIGNAAPEMFGEKDFLNLPNLKDLKSLSRLASSSPTPGRRLSHWPITILSPSTD